MNPDLRGSSAHVLVDDPAAPALEHAELHHLSAVLRLRTGEVVTATDGAGRWARCRWTGAGLALDGDVVGEAPPVRMRSVACAIPKGERADLVVEKLTEVGIDRIVWVHTARQVVRWDAQRARKAAARMERVARAAAMQSRRVRLPVIEGPVALAEVLARPGVAVADPGGDPCGPGGLGNDTDTLVVGPEGGFVPDELPGGIARVSLGDTVLRVETAAILSGWLLVKSWSTF